MRKTVLKVHLPKSVTDIYDEELGTLNDILPYPLWTRKPEWTKKKRLEGRCPVTYLNSSKTYGSCPSVTNFINKSVVIPWPSDFSIARVDDEIKWNVFPESLLGIDTHSREQLPPWEDRGNIKFLLPYTFSGNGPVLFCDPHLHKDSANRPFRSMLGLINPQLKVSANVNTLWDQLEEGKVHNFLAGTPMCYMTFPSAKGKVQVEIVKTEATTWPVWWKKATSAFILK